MGAVQMTASGRFLPSTTAETEPERTLEIPFSVSEPANSKRGFDMQIAYNGTSSRWTTDAGRSLESPDRIAARN